jgi:hypothetical protein
VEGGTEYPSCGKFSTRVLTRWLQPEIHPCRRRGQGQAMSGKAGRAGRRLGGSMACLKHWSSCLVIRGSSLAAAHPEEEEVLLQEEVLQEEEEVLLRRTTPESLRGLGMSAAEGWGWVGGRGEATRQGPCSTLQGRGVMIEGFSALHPTRGAHPNHSRPTQKPGPSGLLTD